MQKSSVRGVTDDLGYDCNMGNGSKSMNVISLMMGKKNPQGQKIGCRVARPDFNGTSVLFLDKRRIFFAISVLTIIFLPRMIQAEGPVSVQIQVRTRIKFAETEGVPLHLDIYVPKSSIRQRHPGILVIHGGAWCAGNRKELSFHARMLAEAGYIAACIDYRLAPKHKFPAQLIDCRSALHWFVNHADALGLDRQRIGLFGYSAGGHLACLLGFSPSERDEPRIRAIVAGGAPCDFRSIPPDIRMLDYWLGGSRSERPRMYQMASPSTYVSADDPPTFFYGGDRDWLVPTFTAKYLSQRLVEVNVPSQYYVCRNEGHLAALMNREAFQRAVVFLDAYLKDHDDDT